VLPRKQQTGFPCACRVHILKVFKVKYYFHLLYAANPPLLGLLCMQFHDCSADDCLQCTFGPRDAAINAVYERFKADCLTVDFCCIFIIYSF